MAALIALSLGLVVIVVGQGFSSIGAVRALEDIALGVIVAAVLMGAAAFVAVRLAGWRDPESESEFEEIVRHSEELAREGLAVDPEESEFMELDPLDDDATSRSSCATRSTTCPTCCATRCRTSPS